METTIDGPRGAFLNLGGRVDPQFAAARFSGLLSATSRVCALETQRENCDSMVARGHQVQRVAPGTASLVELPSMMIIV